MTDTIHNDPRLPHDAQILYRRMRMLPHGSIARCARDTGLNQRYISNILRGRNTAAPTLDKIRKWIEAEERRFS